MPRSGLGSELNQVGSDSPKSVQLCRISVRLLLRSGETHLREVGLPDSENKDPHGPGKLISQDIHIRYVDWYFFTATEKVGRFGTSSYEAHSMATEESLACLRVL